MSRCAWGLVILSACVEDDPLYLSHVSIGATTLSPIETNTTAEDSDDSTGSGSSTTGFADGTTSTDANTETRGEPSTSASEDDASESGSPVDLPPTEPPCDIVFADDFEDGIIHPRWSVWGQNAGVTIETGGLLQFPLPAGQSPAAGLTAGEPGDLANNRITLELVTMPNNQALAFTFQVSGSCTTQVRIQGQTIQVGNAPADLYDPVQQRFLRIEVDGTSSFVYSSSPDGVAWTTMHTQPACALASGTIFIFAQGQNLGIPSTVQLGSFENCKLSSVP